MTLGVVNSPQHLSPKDEGNRSSFHPDGVWEEGIEKTTTTFTQLHVKAILIGSDLIATGATPVQSMGLDEGVHPGRLTTRSFKQINKNDRASYELILTCECEYEKCYLLYVLKRIFSFPNLPKAHSLRT